MDPGFQRVAVADADHAQMALVHRLLRRREVQAELGKGARKVDDVVRRGIDLQVGDHVGPAVGIAAIEHVHADLKRSAPIPPSIVSLPRPPTNRSSPSSP